MTSNKSKNVTFFVGADDLPDPLLKFKAQVHKDDLVSFRTQWVKGKKACSIQFFKGKETIYSCMVPLEPHKVVVDWRED